MTAGPYEEPQLLTVGTGG